MLHSPSPFEVCEPLLAGISRVLTGNPSIPGSLGALSHIVDAAHLHAPVVAFGLRVRADAQAYHGQLRTVTAEEVANTIVAVGLTKALADEVLKTQAFAQDTGGKLYRYRDGVHMPEEGR